MDAQEIRDALHGMYGGENKLISSSIGVFPMWVSNP